MNVDDALSVIIDRLRRSPDQYREHGFDIYLPRLWRDYVRERDGLTSNDSLRAGAHDKELSPVFYSAAWDLCRKGLLRPSVRDASEYLTQTALGGNGYSFTPMGRRFFEQVDELQFIPTEPSRISAMLGRFQERFGDGYHQRAQEAVRCYHSLAYLACCAMCGAAAESILLAAAIAKTGDEQQILRRYRTAQGRVHITNLLVGQDALGSRFRSLLDLLSYWRDESAHGVASDISEIEAFDALGRLLRLSHMADDHWDGLTTT